MKIIVVMAVLLSAVPVGAFDPWSKQDAVLEATYLAVHLLDWGQTRDIVAREKEGYYEAANPVLGKHPSMAAVNAWFIGSSLAHIGITHVLPKQARPWFQGVTLGIATGCVIRNYSIGLNVRF